jgi:hypothetical protein
MKGLCKDHILDTGAFKEVTMSWTSSSVREAINIYRNLVEYLLESGYWDE